MRTCLYITCPSFSGSTLLTMLLARHLQIGTIGEMKGGQEDLATYACSCGELFAKCPFWAHLISALEARGFVYDLADRRTMPAFRMPGSPIGDRLMRRGYGTRAWELLRDFMLRTWPGCTQRLDYLRRYNEAFMDLVLQSNGSSIFLDSSKDPVRIKYLADIASLDLYILHLIRDGRGVVNSSQKNLRIAAHEAAIEWRQTHLEIERITTQFDPSRLARVRYEDLCRDPNATLRTIFEFIGLPAQNIDRSEPEREVHVLGNRMRLKSVPPIRLDDSWKREMSAADLTDFFTVAGSLNAMYGYGNDSGEP